MNKLKKKYGSNHFNVFDFTLSDEDMKTSAELDKKTSCFFSHQNPNMVEWFVKMVEERKRIMTVQKKKRTGKHKRKNQ